MKGQKKLAERKGAAAKGAAANGKASLEKRCRTLVKERNRLRAEIAQLRQERDDYRRAVISSLMKEPVDYDMKELLAQFGKQQPFEEFLAELESQVCRS